MTDSNHLERIADAAAAENAMARWLGPAFDAVTDVYRARLQSVASKEPWETAKIAKVAMALTIAAEVRKQIEMVVADGKVAMTTKREREKIEAIPHERRKWLGI